MNIEFLIQLTAVAVWILGALCAIGGLAWLALAIWGHQVLGGIHRNIQLLGVLAKREEEVRRATERAGQP